MNYKDEYFMSLALEQAKNGFDKGEIPVGCVIVINDKIISKACNLVETLNDVTAHCEILCITSAASYIGCKYLYNATIYVTLEPCPMCYSAILFSRINRIVYGSQNSIFSNKIQNYFNKINITSGVLGDKCLKYIKDFFINIRKLK